MKTDAQLKLDVTNELAWEPSIVATGIGVAVIDGVITLTGQVASYAEKLAAEAAVQRVAGVRAVTVDLRVSLSEHSQRGNVELARTARRTLEWTSNVPDDKIKVMVERGWITLSGDVDWDYQRRAASTALQAMMGVAGVIDAITLTRHDVAGGVVRAIASALARDAQVDSRRIHVVVEGNQVTLSGQVPTGRSANWRSTRPGAHRAWPP